ncbi:hypothetical protein QFC19_002755 [Naganishia cerealis]|uniref:Uncharacterized protein n=1 Tax=Naganishia cerealis TaxID=610337 RepID=A0ACC2W9G9_9TREE|nr:hypothetical protein QFC19_002755 [Naganishia cerealis]
MHKVYNLFVSVLQWDVDRMIDSGLWISPRAISDRLKEAAQTGCPTEAALPLMDIYNPPLQNPTLRKRELDVSEDWAYKDRVPPRLVVAIMQRTYIDILPDRIEATLKSLKTMVSKISDDNMDLAEAKAASMDVNELLAWLNDPRMHIANWWHGQPIIKPITQTDIARVLSSKSPAAESVSKRKRDDSDLSDDETGKMTKRQDNRSAAVSTLSKAERATDVVLDNVGPPTPPEPEMQPSSPSTPSNNFQTSLFMLAPEKVNQLPWPKPQIVLSERECEYLRMTEYNEKKVKSDSLYSVPARCSELDEVTKEIIMQQWQNITASFSICRCTVCRRAREYEKLLVAESTNQYSEYISLLSSETRTEDMTDFQRTWLANQAALLKTSIASPEEDLEQEELQLSEEEEEDANWPAIRDRNELEHYSDGYEYDESDDEMKEVPNADDVAYDTPGARLQQDPR